MSYPATLLQNLIAYLDYKTEQSARAQHYALPFDSNAGLCSGIVAYWLYCRHINNTLLSIEDANAEINYILNFDLAEFADTGLTQDPVIERFLNNVLFLHHDRRLRSGVRQDDLATSVNLLLDAKLPQVLPAEFQITCVFNRSALVDLLSAIARPNKMIRLDIGLHTIGLYKSETGFELIDPNSSMYAVAITDPTMLVEAIFKAFGSFTNTPEYIAIYISIFDTQQKSVAPYLDPLEYCKNLLAKPRYKAATIGHPNIFHLAAKYHQFALLDLLYTSGYRYIPWTLTPSTEFDHAIINNDQVLFDYLVMRKIPLNYHSPTGITPLAKAIMEDNIDMLYALLSAGADPNKPAFDDVSLTYAAVSEPDDPKIAALILLLASGMELSAADEQLLQTELSPPQLRAIARQVVRLNALLLNIPEPEFKDSSAPLELHITKPRDLGPQFNLVRYSALKAQQEHHSPLSFNANVKPLLTI